MVCHVEQQQHQQQSKSKRIKKKKSMKNLRRKSDFDMVKEKKKVLVAHEFAALKSLLPASNSNSSLDVVLQAIDYIQQLQCKLAHIDPEVLKRNYLNSISSH